MRVKKLVCHSVFFLICFVLFQSAGFAASLVDSLALGLERNIGFFNYRTVISEKAVVKLPHAKEQHIHELFQRLVKNCDRSKELKFSLTFVQDDRINAFALPAGYVFVNTGLLSSVKNDGELAGILGHELAHIERRHSMNAIYRAVGFSFALSMLLNGDDNARRGQEISRIAGISMRLAQLGYSRRDELEADRCGVEIMERAGYNRKDILNFWQRYYNRNGNTSKVLTILSTHPPTGERIKQIQNLP
jgi:predicted Zn-dependent protease